LTAKIIENGFPYLFFDLPPEEPEKPTIASITQL
jgi:hypothetical protein